MCSGAHGDFPLVGFLGLRLSQEVYGRFLRFLSVAGLLNGQVVNARNVATRDYQRQYTYGSKSTFMSGT